MNIAQIETRALLLSYLDAAGVRGDAATAIADETAPARHALRVERAKAAARAAVQTFGIACTALDPEEGGAHYDAATAAMLCLLDAAGIGGRGGVEGHGTDRLVPFRVLGKGRKHATDGSAWSGAIACATQALLAEVAGPGARALFRASPNGCALNMVVRTQGGDEHTGAAIDADHRTLTPWLMTLAREGLRRSLGLDPWLTFERVQVDFDAKEAPAWAALVNRLTEDPPAAE